MQGEQKAEAELTNEVELDSPELFITITHSAGKRDSKMFTLLEISKFCDGRRAYGSTGARKMMHSSVSSIKLMK